MKTISRITLLAALILFHTTGAWAADESAGIANRRGNASPSAAASNVDDYTYQDEQVNLGPDDADVLVLRANQKNLLNRFVTKAFPLKNVKPRELRTVYREIVGKEGGRAEVIHDKIKKEYFLQVVCPVWQLPYIEESVKLLDEQWIGELHNGSERIYYQAQHRDVAAIDRLASNWGGEGHTELDETQNAITRLEEPGRAKGYLTGAQLVDVPEHQGRFHIRIYETNTNNDLQLGLDYIAWKNGPGRNLFEWALMGYNSESKFHDAESFLNPFLPGAQAAGSNTSHMEGSANLAYYNFFISAAYYDFLSVKGKAKLLAEGTINVRSGSVGSLASIDPFVGFDVQPNNPGPDGVSPDRISDREPSLNAGDTPIHDRIVRYRQTGVAGLIVDIAPVILQESAEVDVAAFFGDVTGVTPSGLPVISSSSAGASARVRDGATLVIGGLTRTEKVNDKQGMPLLSRIPGLGYLFGGEKNINREKQIVIVIECELETGDASKLANPESLADLSAIVSGETAPDMPNNRFGFDQWLLGEGSGPNL